MNIHTLSLISEIAEQCMQNFSKLSKVQSAIYSGITQDLLTSLRIIVEFYGRFFQQIDFLPPNRTFYKRSLCGNFELEHQYHKDQMIRNVAHFLSKNILTRQQLAIPVHVRYHSSEELFFASGLAWAENNLETTLLLVETGVPKHLINISGRDLSYLQEIVKLYNQKEKQLVRDFINIRGYNYNLFQKDCKAYFGETFYAFCNKLKIINAVNDIIYSKFSFKEIAFKNGFLDYKNMHKIFKRFDLILSEIPRLG